MSFGSDFAGFDDLDANWTFLEGDAQEQLALTQAVARRFITSRDGNPWDPAYGLNLCSFLSSTVDPSMVQPAIEAEARKDERVDDCSAAITVVGNTWTVVINCKSSISGNFTFTVSVSQVSVQLVTVGPQ